MFLLFQKYHRNIYTLFIKFQLNQEIQVKNNEAQRESRKKDKMERELKQAKADLDAKTGEIKNLQGRVENYKGDISKLEQQMKEQKVGLQSDFVIAKFFRLERKTYLHTHFICSLEIEYIVYDKFIHMRYIYNMDGFLFWQILNERTIKDADILHTRFAKLQSDFESQLITTDQLTAENQARVTELKVLLKSIVTACMIYIFLEL